MAPSFGALGVILVASLVAGFAVHLPVRWLMEGLWARFYAIPGAKDTYVEPNVHRAVHYFSQRIGVLERIIYTASWMLGHPEAIAIILALKAAPAVKEWGEQRAVGRAMFNLWLIGNLCSVIGSVLIAEIFHLTFVSLFP